MSILPDERTTHNNALALPTHVEAMVVAPDRRLAQPAVSFLRQEAIAVQLATDIDSAFEEALMHPPDVIVVDGRVSAAGGVDLCERLKGNVRTHFVPTIVQTDSDEPHVRLSAIAGGADAVFSPAVDLTERRTRLWALLRTRALFRRLDRKQRRQGAELGERRRWVSYLLHDLQGAVGALRANVEYLAQFAPAAADRRSRDFREAVEDAATTFDQLLHNVRTVLAFDRFEGGSLAPLVKSARLSDVARKVAGELFRGPPVDAGGVPGGGNGEIEVTVGREEPPASIDVPLIRVALLNLMLHCARGRGRRTRVTVWSEDPRVVSVRVSCAGLSFSDSEKARLFEPYVQLD
ncbi:MAG TPA: response regulator, partial [Polyangia bacterium]